MADFISNTYKNATVQLDGNNFVRCTFEKCRLEYSGGSPPSLIENSFIDCQWVFNEGAANTATFLRSLVAGGVGGMVARMLGLPAEGS